MWVRNIGLRFDRFPQWILLTEERPLHICDILANQKCNRQTQNAKHGNKTNIFPLLHGNNDLHIIKLHTNTQTHTTTMDRVRTSR